MRYITIMIVLLFSATSLAKTNCKVHKLYCTMVELQPHVDKEWALEFSNILYRLSKKYKTDPHRTIALMMQESSLLGLQHKTKGYIFKEDCSSGECVEVAVEAEVYTDVGWFQFHYGTIKRLGLDPVRLKSDLYYATNEHLKLLKAKIRACQKYKNEAWSCYHSATPGIRETYVKRVNRYYKGSNK